MCYSVYKPCFLNQKMIQSDSIDTSLTLINHGLITGKKIQEIKTYELVSKKRM